jgi:hypothetical protein
MAAKLGLAAKLYYLTTGNRATWGTADADGVNEGAAPANLAEITVARDVTVDLSKGEADVTSRGANGWRQMVGTLKEGEITFDMIWDTADTSFAAIFSAYITDGTIAVAALDGANDEAGTEGLWADCSVTQFQKSEPLEEAQTVSVTLRPTYSSVAPEWVRVTAGT